MGLAFHAATAAVSSSSDSSATLTWVGSPGSPGDMLIAAFGFEGVSAGAGPWIPDNSGFLAAAGWARALFQGPSATGCGLEVWHTDGWTTGATQTFAFDTTHSYVAQGFQYTGQLVGDLSAVVRIAATAQTTGDNPQTPSIYTFQNEMVVAFASDQLTTPGYGTPTSPTGFTKRGDSARGSTFGNVEITAADKLTVVEGDTGAITWTAASASGSNKGATGVIAIRPPAGTIPPATPGATSPHIRIKFAVT